MSAQRTVAKASGIMMLAAIASRLLGWLRDRAIGHTFGRSYETDAYWAAFSVPDVLYYLFAGGALSAAFIPVLTEYLAQAKERQGWRVTSSIANGMLLLISGGVVVWIIIAPFWVRILAPGFAKDSLKFWLCVRLTRILCPMVIFTGLSALCTGILNSYQHFTAPAVAWSVYNLGITAAALWWGPRIGIEGLCYGVLAGALGMVLVQLPVLWKKGFRFFFILDWRDSGVRKIVKLFIPATVGLAISQLNLVVVPQIFGSYIADAVTAFRYANRLIILVFGLFAVSIATAAFPTLSRQVVEEKIDEVKSTLVSWLGAIFFLVVPAMIGLLILRLPILTLLWQTGKFELADVNATAFALLFYCFGILGLSGVQLITRGFYAFRDMRTPALVSLGMMTLNFLLCYVFLAKIRLGLCGPPLAASIVFTVNMLMLGGLFRRKVGAMGLRRILFSFSKILLASLIMGLFCWVYIEWLNRFLDMTKIISVAIEVISSIIIGVMVYVGLAYLLRLPELGLVLEMMKGKRGNEGIKGTKRN